jgi:hypothetical protein
MTLDLKAQHSIYGHTIAEHIQTVPGELPIDAVGLWQILPDGRECFGLSGDDLIEFVRLCIFALLEKGAVPVSGGKGTGYDWVHQPQYGKTKEDIADAIINIWQAWLAAVERGDIVVSDDLGEMWFAIGIWFALPEHSVGFLDTRKLRNKRTTFWSESTETVKTVNPLTNDADVMIFFQPKAGRAYFDNLR